MSSDGNAVLSGDEIERYARHIVLADLGGVGQQKLKNAKVLVIGAGGLGSPCIQYLAAAGVGTIGIVDDDVVSLSNLQRQVLHSTKNVGKAKVESASESVADINPHVICNLHNCRLTHDNADALVGQYDLLVDGSDNFDTRYLAADVAERQEVPLVTAAVGQFDGSITTLKPYEKNADGDLNPRYRDLFPTPPEPGTIPTCEEAGVLGALTGILGSMQALEVIKEITGVGDGLVGRLLLYDARRCRFQLLNYRRAPE
ncbi:MAG: molybdopterin-synthase adenylyltransferase MoeB [Pseudomonadota bacterium]